METKSVWDSYSKAEESKVFAFAEGYKSFLSDCKTERECITYFKNEAKKQGYIDFEDVKKKKRKLKAGDRVFFVNMNKSIILFNIGKKSLENGLNILGAHIDSPRLDAKQNPLYEKNGFAYFDTHYYGGIKKYQWVTIPLAIHGVVVKKDGTVIEITIGEKETDPVFFVSDLLIHLAQDQMEKKASKVIEGEALDIIVGNKPVKINKKDADKKADPVKEGILEIIKKQYKFEDEDFMSAELEIVPAGKARDAGFDKSMILAYGHDDKVCSYPSFEAIVNTEKVERTACCILVDKEEIGSVGATGMRSRFFENSVAELMSACGEYSDIALRRCLANSFMLSSDVSSAFDPSFASSFDQKNVAFLGHGMDFCKFTGSRGKSGSNDANAEYIAKIRKIMEGNKVSMQMSELGKVDLGGGGTIAYILALYGMNVIDCGVPVLNMHAPYEAISKADLYEAYKGYSAFLREA